MSEEGYGAYDPSAPEGSDQAHSQYVTKKDVRVILVVIAVLTACCYPVFKMLERNAQRSVCATNLKAVSSAIGQYAEMHDERFPPIMRTGPNNEPDLGTSGFPYTWASDVADLMSKRASFRCPTATDEEVTRVETHGGSMPITYGMYQPYGGYLRTIVPNPDQTVLVAETSNMGANNTYDPLPYKTIDGKTVPFDGFVIGWSNTNADPTSASTYITRLAFADTSKANFDTADKPRHDGGIHALNCSGAMMRFLLKPSDARVRMSRDLPGGLWEAPPMSAGQR
ncbi:hypothetical protein [Fimbriimonas ginsengisoli]|uniref:OmpA-like domain-containing protein n=1 Tax=Fimbriimonas ginsengisoli Gsoil 348 TaxID=661478 RepID=A0A068NVT4_FIMGI|nr:hypothetical protein [Fimbriimonas ginsengisoli]AIE87618.1 hypothetical protein OP10G_4250 [Fimbriimonas ginsengisoli Gsoil 348]